MRRRRHQRLKVTHQQGVGKHGMLESWVVIFVKGVRRIRNNDQYVLISDPTDNWRNEQ